MESSKRVSKVGIDIFFYLIVGLTSNAKNVNITELSNEKMSGVCLSLERDDYC